MHLNGFALSAVRCRCSSHCESKSFMIELITFALNSFRVVALNSFSFSILN
jgi:hypothetical protein